jgi:transposase
MIPLLNRGGMMKGFVQGADRQQTTLLPECLDDWVDESNPVRAVDVFVDALELRDLGFDGVDPAATGRPAYHPSAMLKLYIYGYLNRVQSSRRLEREAGRNLEVMWLTGRLVPDHKTIADFRKDNGPAIKKVKWLRRVGGGAGPRRRATLGPMLVSTMECGAKVRICDRHQSARVCRVHGRCDGREGRSGVQHARRRVTQERDRGARAT